MVVGYADILYVGTLRLGDGEAAVRTETLKKDRQQRT